MQIMNSNYLNQSGVKNLNYLVGHILYHVFKTISNISLKNMKNINNLPIQIYINNIENRIAFIVKLGHSFRILISETMELNRDNNRENVTK